MRCRRHKVDPRFEASTNHLTTRTNNRERCLHARENRKLLELFRQAAVFCGMKIHTHAMMLTHPHVLVFTPLWTCDPDDAELIRRYRVLNPKAAKGPTKYRWKSLEVIAAHLKANTEEGIEWRKRQLAQMGDISQFMKIVKERFTAWFNRRHGRSGTIWGGRFKNVLVEGKPGALLTMAAYIDNNPVRAGIVNDPKDYAFSGYGEAVAGSSLARQGITTLMDLSTWERAQPEYRKFLFARGSIKRTNKAAIPLEDFERVVAEGGQLSLGETLQCRIRRFTDSVVFGSQEFVAKHLATFVKANRRKRPGRPCPMPSGIGLDGLTTLRGLRRG